MRKFLWRIISKAESIYWSLWRANLKNRFAKMGDNVYIATHSYFMCENISIGDDVYIGPGARFQATKGHIYIGSHVMFGPNVSIHSGNHRIDIPGKYMKQIGLEDKRPEDDKDIIIEDDVWIGDGVIILNGVKIGEGSVIGAGTVVSRDVPPYSIVTGSKNYSVRPRFNENQLQIHRNKIEAEI